MNKDTVAKPSISRRQMLKAAGIALSGAVLAACGATPTATPVPAAKATATTAPPTATPAPKNVDLRVYWWGSQDRYDRTVKVIELFTKNNPNVKMTYEGIAWADYWTKALTMAAGNNLPDIMQQDYAYITEYANKGLLVALDDFTKSNVLNITDVVKDVLDPGRIGGKLYGVNLGSNSQIWICDTDLFTKAGVALPANNWTWTDFEKTSLAITDKLSIWGHGANCLGDEQLWGAVYLSLGQWRYSADGKAMGYTDDKPFVDYLNMILRLEKAKSTPSRAEDWADYRGKSIELYPIVPAKSAMAYVWSNQIVAIWKAAGETRNFKLFPVPREVGGKSANFIKASQFFSVTRDSKAPKEATMFVDFFTNSTEANDLLFAERGVPIAGKIQAALKPKLGQSQAAMFDFVSEVSKDVQPCPPPDPAGHADVVNNVLHPLCYDQVLYGKITPEKGAETLRVEGAKILAAQK
jgi:multiple sugar transport system substrate-binding protein